MEWMKWNGGGNGPRNGMGRPCKLAVNTGYKVPVTATPVLSSGKPLNLAIKYPIASMCLIVTCLSARIFVKVLWPDTGNRGADTAPIGQSRGVNPIPTKCTTIRNITSRPPLRRSSYLWEYNHEAIDSMTIPPGNQQSDRWTHNPCYMIYS